MAVSVSGTGPNSHPVAAWGSRTINEHAERQLTFADFRQAIAAIRQPAAILPRGNALTLLAETGGVWWRVVIKSANQGRE